MKTQTLRDSTHKNIKPLHIYRELEKANTNWEIFIFLNGKHRVHISVGLGDLRNNYKKHSPAPHHHHH